MDARTGIKTEAGTAPDAPAERRWIKISPINKRRWENFKANRRGYWSLWIFLALFLVSLFAEFIANDKPMLIHVNGRFFFPAVFTYPDTAFAKGDDPSLFGTAADYRDEYLIGLIEKEGGTVIWPPVHFSYNTQVSKPPSPFPSKPTWMLTKKDCEFAASHGFAKCDELESNWLGTDDGGRDVLARLIYGFRISVLFGLALTIISSIIGVAAGAVQGYFGGWTDLLFQRFIEIWSSLPHLYLLIIVSSIITPSFLVLLVILLLFSWVSLVHVVRAEFLRARNFEYVNAARALGLSNAKIIFKHVLPNAMVATLTFLPFILNSSITTLTSLDFLGFGLPPRSPSLGELLLQGKSNLQAPWLGLTGFIVIAIMLSLLVFTGEAVRDAFDPRKTFERG